MSDALDALGKLVSTRDKRFTDAKRLRLMQRNAGVTRRLCSVCWRMLDDDPRHPASQCSDCGGPVHEVTL